mgnify:CR=1 FL=1
MKKLVEVILIILLCVGCTPNKESVSTKEEIINNIKDNALFSGISGEELEELLITAEQIDTENGKILSK